MRGQFSIEFLIDVSVILVIAAFIGIFFSQFLNPPNNATTMQNICSMVANSINSVSNYGGLSSVFYLPLLNLTQYGKYNISISHGIIIVANTNGNQRTNTVSCGSDTLATANESFTMSNLVLYSNGTIASAAYLYGNNGLSEPSQVYGGGFSSNVSLYLVEPNKTTIAVANESSTFTYTITLLLAGLPNGAYTLYARENAYPAITVYLPFSK